jgi:hypothetical protein
MLYFNNMSVYWRKGRGGRGRRVKIKCPHIPLQTADKMNFIHFSFFVVKSTK